MFTVFEYFIFQVEIYENSCAILRLCSSYICCGHTDGMVCRNPPFVIIIIIHFVNVHFFQAVLGLDVKSHHISLTHIPSLWPSGIGSRLGRNRLWVRFLAVSDIYPMFIEPTITWVPSEISGYIWLDTKIVFKKKKKSLNIAFIYLLFIVELALILLSCAIALLCQSSQPLPSPNLVFFSSFVPYLVPNSTMYLYIREPSGFNSF